jgi:VacB/RNase II family 3'-5' exoribonuclease
MQPRNNVDLYEIARETMIERGLDPDFGPPVEAELKEITAPATMKSDIRDLRDLLWCSIDNDDSRDLDQLTYADGRKDGNVTILVAVADVDALVPLGTQIDAHARKNTTSVYTSGGIFPMLPEKLSTDLTSLNDGEDRVAIVIEMGVDGEGSVQRSDVYRALVHNQAKLAYSSVGAWLEGQGTIPANAAVVPHLNENLRLQDSVAQRLRERRHERGALEFETIEPHPVTEAGKIVDLKLVAKNRAMDLIEDFMIAANQATTRFLSDRNFPTFRRVVREPERWDRIEALAAGFGVRLPPDADAVALAQFLIARRKADPLRFPDLSLSIVKLLGRGQYVAEEAGSQGPGHFGLAIQDYAHSTAPNRRYPDLVTHRLLKAAMANRPSPYRFDELGALAEHCTTQEDAANKVERKLRKAVAAIVLSDRIGQTFDGIVTGAADKGTWVRIFQPPVEGRVIAGEKGMDVGEKVRVKLVSTDPQRGFINFVGISHETREVLPQSSSPW